MANTPLNADQLNRLQAIGERLHAYDDITELCWATAGWIKELCAVEDCVVYVRLGNILTQIAAIGVKEQDATIVNQVGLPLGTGIAGAVGLSAVAEYVPDISQDERYIFDEFQGRSEFAVPVVHLGEVLGVIDSEHQSIDGISPRDRQIMQALATLIAPHLAALLRLKQGGAPDYVDVLADLTRLPAITQGNLESACATITERAARTLRAGRATIWLFKDGEREHDLACIDCYELKTNSHSSGQTLVREQHPNYFAALASERVIIANDARSDLRTKELVGTYLRDADVYSLMGAPIRQDGRVVGVLGLEATGTTREWSSNEASFVGTLSDFATIALVSRAKSVVQGALVQSQKMESLGRLAAGISHDFNNLLTVITGAVETLQRDTQRSESDNRLLNLVQEAGERARKLTRNLMAFGGNQHLRLEPTNVASLLASVKDLTESIIREDIKVEFDEPAAVWINCDATQIEQVILNLMINSVDAMPSGGRLSVSIGAHDDESVRISVTDTGCGMTASVRQRIFEPFFTTKGEDGTGLGLSISLGIIRQHAGTIDCRTAVDQGTQFDVVLPRANIPVDAAQTDPELEGTIGSATMQNVLLVEDEVGVRNVVTEMITALGYKAIVADNAAHALQILEQDSIDLLLSDIIMPDMRGPDLYRAALERVPRLPALFVSGYSEDVISGLPTRDNRVGYLGKPFTMTQLDDAIQAVVSR